MAPIVDIVTGGTRGLIRDAEIAYDVLKSYPNVTIHISRLRNLHLLHRRLSKTLVNMFNPKPRVLVFFENLPSDWMKLSDTRILVPNQEWIRKEVAENMDKCTLIWCKTRYAEAIFRERNFQTRYIGFTSADIFMPEIKKDYGKFIHVAGRSHLKGTKAILELWQAHNEWPALLVISSNKEWKQLFPLHHVTFLANSLSDYDLRVAMNSCGIHLCPSETEGFGHYISEALSSKAVTITANAPPMNEIITPESGLLALATKGEAMGFGYRFFVDKDSLEQMIIKAIEMDTNEKMAMGEAARKSYESQRADFRSRLIEAMNELVEQNHKP
jgi:glycosyltransferase involved in cell wall biosynthesis